MASVDYEGLPSVSMFGPNAECAFDLQMPFDDGFFNSEPLMELPGQIRDNPSYIATTQSVREASFVDTLQPADPVSALARLNEHISRQIPRIDMYLLESGSEPQHCRNDISESRGKPADEMLQSTTRFIAILEALEASFSSAERPIPSRSRQQLTSEPSHNESSIEGRVVSPSQPLSPKIRAPTFSVSLSTPLVLMLLSSYILLLELYDTVFRHVHDKVSRLPNVLKFSLEMPEIQVGGLSSMKVHLYAKIVIQTIEHHFDRIEHLLGLPVEFGLSERHPRSDGLLGNANLSHLLRLAMTQVTGSPGKSGRLALQSFRDNLKGVQAILPD